MSKPAVKTKRKLTDIDFSGSTTHIALVGPAVGGPASGADYALVIKSLDTSPELIQKMQQVKVTLELPEFLRKFFGVYYEDADVLARLMGYVPPDKEESDTESETYAEYCERCIQEKLDQFEVMKSVSELSAAEILAKIGPEKFVELVETQGKLEKSVLMLDRVKNSSKVAPVTKAETSTELLVENTEVGASPSVNLEKSMTIETKVDVEMVEKSVLDNLQVELQKANDTIATFVKEKKEAVLKARKDKVVAAVKDAARAEVLFKALSLIEDESEFEAVVKSLSEMQTVVDKSALFEEKGAAVDTQEPNKESMVAKALKAQKIVK